jgi:hypothetical protein
VAECHRVEGAGIHGCQSGYGRHGTGLPSVSAECSDWPIGARRRSWKRTAPARPSRKAPSPGPPPRRRPAPPPRHTHSRRGGRAAPPQGGPGRAGPTRTADRGRRGRRTLPPPAPSTAGRHFAPPGTRQRRVGSSSRAGWPRPPDRARADDLAGTARGGLETQGAGAREGIEAAPAVERLPEPVEKGLADPVRSRAQPGRSTTGSLVRFQLPPMMRTSRGSTACARPGALGRAFKAAPECRRGRAAPWPGER